MAPSSNRAGVANAEQQSIGPALDWWCTVRHDVGSNFHFVRVSMNPALAALLFLTMTGCVSGSSTKTAIDEKSLSNIQVCKTTKKDLVDMYGEPEKVGYQSSINTYEWTYRPFVAGPGDTKRLIAFVNKSDKVVEYSVNPSVKIIDVVDKCTK